MQAPRVPLGRCSRLEGSWPVNQEQSLGKVEQNPPQRLPSKLLSTQWSFYGQGTIVTEQFQIFIITFPRFVLFYSNGYKTQVAEKYISGYINLLSLFHISNLYSGLSALQVQHDCAQTQELNKSTVSHPQYLRGNLQLLPITQNPNDVSW